MYFQVNRLEYLEAMTLYGTYSISSINKTVDAVNQLHIIFYGRKKPKW